MSTSALAGRHRPAIEAGPFVASEQSTVPAELTVVGVRQQVWIGGWLESRAYGSTAAICAAADACLTRAIGTSERLRDPGDEDPLARHVVPSQGCQSCFTSSISVVVPGRLVGGPRRLRERAIR